MPQHEIGLAEIKELITEAPVPSYYDVNKEVITECDSSEIELGGVIMQEDHSIAYASRTLTRTECNCTHTEKECLANEFTTERLSSTSSGRIK